VIALGAPPAPAADGALETRAVRLSRTAAICIAPQYVAEELLRAEGFTDISYIESASTAEIPDALARGELNVAALFAPQWASAVDGGGVITILAGMHVGCFELFGNERVRKITDLKGKIVGVTGLRSSDHLFVSVMAAHVGLDPVNDIHWIASRSPTPAALFADGKIDACLGLPRCPKISAPGTLGKPSSIARWTTRGRNNSAACSPATGTGCRSIRARPNGSCGRY
jgi:NitT/TauT family transport system substrate-binding protein